jgi:predicted transcriptional regulator
MARPKPSRPTDAELAILNVLWQHNGARQTEGSGSNGEGEAEGSGESQIAGLTIRQIVAELKKVKPSTYATIQTLVRIMEKKGLLRRGEERYPAIYRPVAPPNVAKGRLLRDFIDRVFGGSMKQMVMHALSGSKTSKREMEQIQKIVEQMEE